MTFENATSGHAEIYYARHMFPGTVEYHDERILVDEQATNDMLPTFKGKPVYVLHQDVDVSNLQNADGVISDSFKNGLDAWSWVKFVAVSDAAKKAIRDGWSVSNAWMPGKWEPHGGTFHNVKFDRRIRQAEYTHLALVPDPRYEEAKIFTEAQYKAYTKAMRDQKEMHNSKGKSMNLLKLFRNKKEEIEMDDIDNVTFEVAGKSVTVAEMLNALAAAELPEKTAEEQEAEKAAETAAEAEKQNAALLATEVEVNGEKMTVAELQVKFGELQEKQNAAEAEAQRAADEAAAEAEKAAAAEDEEKQKQFDKLNSASQNTAPAKQIISTTSDRVRLGQDRYGSGS